MPFILKESLVIVMAFLSIFFGRDLGPYNFLCLRPILLTILAAIILIKAFSLFRKKQSVRLINVIEIVVGVVFLVLFLVFTDEIAYSREIIYFTQNRSDFEQAVAVASEESDCVSQVGSSCSEYVEIDVLDTNLPLLVIKGNTTASFVLSIYSRQYVNYVYFPDHDSLPRNENIHRYGVNCYIQLDPNWYICSVSV